MQVAEITKQQETYFYNYFGMPYKIVYKTDCGLYFVTADSLVLPLSPDERENRRIRHNFSSFVSREISPHVISYELGEGIQMPVVVTKGLEEGCQVAERLIEVYCKFL